MTFVELIVSVGAGTVLMLGIAATLGLSMTAFDGSQGGVSASRLATVRDDLADDLRYALSADTSTASEITVTVPDRDNDGVAEKITYRWTGAVDRQLQRMINGGNTVVLHDAVVDFERTLWTRTAPGTAVDPGISNPLLWGSRWGE